MLSLHCCSRAFSHCSGFCCCRSQALGTRASVIMAHGPSCSVAYGVLVPRLGIEPVSPALAGGLNHWTTREVPLISAPRWDSHCALLHSAGWLPYISLLKLAPSQQMTWLSTSQRKLEPPELYQMPSTPPLAPDYICGCRACFHQEWPMLLLLLDPSSWPLLPIQRPGFSSSSFSP